MGGAALFDRVTSVTALRRAKRIPEWPTIAVATGVGFIGSVLVSGTKIDLGDLGGLAGTLVAVGVATMVTYSAPTYGIWLVFAAIVFPVQLRPYTLTVTVALGFYFGVVGRVLARRERLSHPGRTTIATAALGAAVMAAAAGAVLTGTAVTEDGGLKAARVFVLLTGIVLSIALIAGPGRIRRGSALFVSFVAVGMSAWGAIEYLGRSRLIPITLQAWTDDPLGKSFVGAVSGGFVGGGPNTYAVFILTALLLLTAEFGSARRGWTRFILVAAGLLALNLAFAYSRGAQLAALLGLAVLAWTWGPRTGRGMILATTGLFCVLTATAYGVGALRSAAAAVSDLPPGHWRTFVANPSWELQQELVVPPGRPPDALWLKVRAASGTGYRVQIVVDQAVVFEGREELPNARRDWARIALPSGLFDGKTRVMVAVRLMGVGNQRDHYFEAEGSSEPILGAVSRFLRDGREIGDDLSFDPGSQRGSYLIRFLAPDELERAASPSQADPASRVDVLAGTTAAVGENDRLQLWGVAIASFAARPIFGAGFSASSDLLRALDTQIAYANFHNEFLEFLANSGAIGLAALVAFFVTLLAVTRRHAREGHGYDRDLALALAASVVALAVAFQFGSFLADSRIAGLLWVLTGLVAASELWRHRATVQD